MRGQPSLEAISVESMLTHSQHAFVVIFVILQTNRTALLLVETASRKVWRPRTRAIFVHGHGTRRRYRLSLRRRILGAGGSSTGHRPLGVAEGLERRELVRSNSFLLGVTQALREANERIVAAVKLVIVLHMFQSSDVKIRQEMIPASTHSPNSSWDRAPLNHV